MLYWGVNVFKQTYYNSPFLLPGVKTFKLGPFVIQNLCHSARIKTEILWAIISYLWENIWTNFLLGMTHVLHWNVLVQKLRIVKNFPKNVRIQIKITSNCFYLIMNILVQKNFCIWYTIFMNFYWFLIFSADFLTAGNIALCLKKVSQTWTIFANGN